MVEVYYHDNNDEVDFREAHHSGETVSLEELASTGVLYYHFDTEEEVDRLAVERSYKNRDTIRLNRATFGDSEEALVEKLNGFYKEHLHEDEEIRYILGGSGFFDVRNKADKWIRCKLAKGDLLILPSGIYHRFTLDAENDIHALRLFKDEPKWIALTRSEELATNEYRKEYLQSIGV
ncbi:hypothetical protein BABINDRAFT_172838 [Babjeviella inositovora NRRL Y-12698]|uniref:Acireductone dioxygenase n=1 Tax=Babjeviella inositovora NRRL Y-12698 TaxID=984486 RepID=A0A1E3QIJ9_9ASCO|nr:uncharacterized protein BABINDRAFT_172838 [Babjeviella inositovora NRRL Y-12698]ODQ77526.1 hypothetical protein BABINDRAFT_172838 [Babjeviella inositovora NRRL Y-12698]